jgi:hypothetical protein
MTDAVTRGAALRPPVRIALALVLLAVASMEWKGYRFGGSNQSLQVPLLRHLMDPSLYARDPILQSFEGYASFFFHLLAPVARLVQPLELLYFVLYLTFHGLALAAIFALGQRLFARPAPAVVACLLYLGQVPSLGAELAYWPRLTHAHVATALLLWALYFHLSGRTRLAFALCGATFNVHALYSGYVFLMLAADHVFRRRERGARQAGIDVGLFLLLALPTLLWIAGRHDTGPIDWWPEWLQIMRERSGPHTFPLSVPAAVFARYLLLLALFGVALAVTPPPERSPALAPFATAVALLCTAGFLLAEVFPVRRVIEAQLLRSTKWLTVFILLYVARLIVSSWGAGGLARGAAIAVFAGLFLQQPAWLVFGLALYLLLPIHALVPETGRLALPVLLTGGLALLAVAITEAASFPERLGLQQLVLALSGVFEKPAVVACLVGFMLLRAASERSGPKAALLAWTSVLGALAVALPMMYRDHRIVVQGEPWNDVQLWVRDHTPRDAVLLTPPHREGFRVFSERAVVGEWKDGTQQFFSSPFTREWRRRMQDLGGGTTPVYDSFPPERLADLAARFGADYVVATAASALPFERLYANDEFAVYRAPGAGALPAAP